jgi:hypothetical protein
LRLRFMRATGYQLLLCNGCNGVYTGCDERKS